ncbi:MAG: hypothetical protein R2797_09460 [Gelidibacter sp.]
MKMFLTRMGKNASSYYRGTPGQVGFAKTNIFRFERSIVDSKNVEGGIIMLMKKMSFATNSSERLLRLTKGLKIENKEFMTGCTLGRMPTVLSANENLSS